MESKHVFMPNVDIVETELSFEIYADMPRISVESAASDLVVEFEKGILEIKGKISEIPEKLANSKHEFASGEYQRKFRIDENAVSSDIKAQYTNGVLKVTLPKKKEVKNKIEIQVA